MEDASALRQFDDAMLDVMVRGQGPASALVPMGILLAFTAVFTLLAARIFRWDTA